MYTLEEYNRIQNDIEYQKILISNNGNNIFKVHNLSEELQLYFLKRYYSSFEFIKFPTEKICLKAVKLYPLNIRYMDNPTKEMCWISIKPDLNTINYIDIVKHPEIFEFYQENYKGPKKDKFTMEKFKLVNYDIDYQKVNYEIILFNRILYSSNEIINFYIDKDEEISHIASCYHLTEEQQNKILDIDSDYFKYFKFPTLDIIYKAIDLRPNNIKYVDLDKYPEIYDYWRLLNI